MGITEEILKDLNIVKVAVVATVGEHKLPAPKERVSIFNTFQAGTPQMILPHSPKRIHAEILVQGIVGTNAAIYLTSTQGDAQQVTAGENYGGGAFIQPGFRLELPTTSEVWMVAIGGTPSFVTVIQVIERD